MLDSDSPHKRLQEHIDCQLEVTPQAVLEQWKRAGWNEESGTDGDEAPLKLMALYVLEAIKERAVRVTVDKDKGATIYGDKTYSLEGAPSHFIARGLEIMREIAGMDVPGSTGKIVLGIKNDSLELIIQKQAGLHIINIPGI
jgi:hypothetical protein